LRAVIPPHHIHNDSHKCEERRERVSALPETTSALDINRDDLAAIVKPAGRANPVRDVRGGALGAGAQLRQLEDAVVSAAHPLAAV